MRLAASIALALCTLPACKKKAPNYRLDLLPAEAQVAGGFDLDGLRKTPHYELLSSMTLESAAMPDYPPCDAGNEDGWSRVLMAGDARGVGQRMVLVLEGAGAVDDGLTDCLRRYRIDVLTPDAEEAKGHGITAIPLDRDTLVLAYPREWADAALARIRGDGTAITAGPLREALDHVDRAQHVWIAGLPPDGAAPGMRDDLGYAPSYMTATVNFTADVVVQVDVEAPRPEVAADRLEDLWKEWRPAAERSPLPKSFLDSVSFKATDDTVRVRARLERVYVNVLDALLRLMG